MNFPCSSALPMRGVIGANQRALQNVQLEIDTWTARIEEYQALKSNLIEIPKETSHSVMVPFGGCAFMPGRLVHTNEVLVLLGENWFVDRSAHQAIEIVQRRIEYCRDMLQKFTVERKFYEDKLKTINLLCLEESENQDAVEIREYLQDDEEENLHISSIERTKVNSEAIEEELCTGMFPLSHELQGNVTEKFADHSLNSNCEQPRKVDEADYLALMNRLDQLLQQEEIEDNKSTCSEDDEDQFVGRPFTHVLPTSSSLAYEAHDDSTGLKRVTWDKIEKVQKSAEISPKIADLPLVKKESLNDPENLPTNNSTLKTFSSTDMTSLKSILKNRTESSPIDQHLLHREEMPVKHVLHGSIEAFSGVIFETSPELMVKKSIEASTSVCGSTKPSKFKSQRTRQQ